jgi:hypothetical protein
MNFMGRWSRCCPEPRARNMPLGNWRSLILVGLALCMTVARIKMSSLLAFKSVILRDHAVE